MELRGEGGEEAAQGRDQPPYHRRDASGFPHT